MWGPSRSGMIAGMLALLLVGAGLGVGCEQGCAYVRSHLHVEWLRN